MHGKDNCYPQKKILFGPNKYIYKADSNWEGVQQAKSVKCEAPNY